LERVLAVINRRFGGELTINTAGLRIGAAELLDVCNSYRAAAGGAITAGWR